MDTSALVQRDESVVCNITHTIIISSHTWEEKLDHRQHQ
jgi:hypothetical protein